MKKPTKGIFENEVEPATQMDDLKADAKLIDTSECVESDEEAQG